MADPSARAVPAPPAAAPTWEEIVTRISIAGDTAGLRDSADAWERAFALGRDLAENLRTLTERARQAWDGLRADDFYARVERCAARLESLAQRCRPVVDATRTCARDLERAVMTIPYPAAVQATVVEARQRYHKTGVLTDISPGAFRESARPDLSDADFEAWLATQHTEALSAYDVLRTRYAAALAAFPAPAEPGRARGNGADGKGASATGSGAAGGANLAGGAASLFPPGTPVLPDGSGSDIPGSRLPGLSDLDGSVGGLAGSDWSGGSGTGGGGGRFGPLGPAVSPVSSMAGAQAAAAPAGAPYGAPSVGSPAGGAAGRMPGMYGMPFLGAGLGGATNQGGTSQQGIQLVDLDGTFDPPEDAPFGVIDVV